MLALEQWVDRLLPSWPLVAAPGAAGEELRQGYEAAGEKLDPYSSRHGHAHSTHLICERPRKVGAAAMGDSVETHLESYSKWCGDDLIDDAVERAARRLGR